jgi:hypothetical protein
MPTHSMLPYSEMNSNTDNVKPAVSENLIMATMKSSPADLTACHAMVIRDSHDIVLVYDSH